MTPRDRLLATLKGKQTDRIAVYTQIPFSLADDGFTPGPFHGYSDYDDWRKHDPAYVKLVKRMESECDNFFIWRPPCMQNTQFFIPPTTGITTTETNSDGKIYYTTEYTVRGISYREVSAKQPGSGHAWQIKHLCNTLQEAEELMKVPWDGHPVEIGDFFKLQDRLGERGVMWVTVPSPIQVVCRIFDPNEFLVLARLEPKRMRRLFETVTERIHTNLESLLELGAGPIVRFGGAEHATPPLMSNEDFDQLVTVFDTPLVNLCKKYGCLVAYHCHGRITHALTRFVEMGVDMTDPVETVPDGDMTPAQARDIGNGKITLVGNIQMNEIALATPGVIRARVASIIDEMGPDHLIISTTGTPLQKMDTRTEENYHAMIDAVLTY